jgi:hypothetical protein
MNAIAPFHGFGTALATTGRLDIRAMIKHFTAPYGATQPFVDLVRVVERNSPPEIRRCRNRRRPAAIAINRAVAGHLDAVSDARDRLSVIRLAPDEEDVRQILGAMLLVYHAQPTQTSGFFVDALVLELREPDADEPYSLPAIAAAARECWQSLASPPAISTFLGIVRQHQRRLDGMFQSLCDIVSASEWAANMVEPEEALDELRFEEDFGFSEWGKA